MNGIHDIMFNYLSVNDDNHDIYNDFVSKLQRFHDVSDSIIVPNGVSDPPPNYTPDISLFLKSIKYGDIAICRYLYSNNKYDIHAYYELPFRWACETGRCEIAKWLYNLALATRSPIDTNTFYYAAFRLAAQNGHFDVVQWLLTISMPDEIAFDCAIKVAYLRKKYDMMNYLFNL